MSRCVYSSAEHAEARAWISGRLSGTHSHLGQFEQLEQLCYDQGWHWCVGDEDGLIMARVFRRDPLTDEGEPTPVVVGQCAVHAPVFTDALEMALYRALTRRPLLETSPLRGLLAVVA